MPLPDSWSRSQRYPAKAGLEASVFRNMVREFDSAKLRAKALEDLNVCRRGNAVGLWPDKNTSCSLWP